MPKYFWLTDLGLHSLIFVLVVQDLTSDQVHSWVDEWLLRSSNSISSACS